MSIYFFVAERDPRYIKSTPIFGFEVLQHARYYLKIVRKAGKPHATIWTKTVEAKLWPLAKTLREYNIVSRQSTIDHFTDQLTDPFNDVVQRKFLQTLVSKQIAAFEYVEEPAIGPFNVVPMVGVLNQRVITDVKAALVDALFEEAGPEVVPDDTPIQKKYQPHYRTDRYVVGQTTRRLDNGQEVSIVNVMDLDQYYANQSFDLDSPNYMGEQSCWDAVGHTQHVYIKGSDDKPQGPFSGAEFEPIDGKDVALTLLEDVAYLFWKEGYTNAEPAVKRAEAYLKTHRRGIHYHSKAIIARNTK